jgi:hypothetical protein
VKIDGIVQAKLNPYLSVQDAPFSFGVGNNSGQFTLSNNDFPRSTGVGNRYREFNPAPYLGALNVSYSGYSTGDRAALVTLYPQFFGITNPTAGAIFRVNAAGTCTVNGVINCSAIGTGSVNPQAGWLVGGAHPLTSLAPQTYAFNIDIVPAQEPAGQCVLQSLRSVTVSGSAVISANGADRAPAFKIVYSNANPSGLVQPPSGVGAGGGGSIHFQAPVLSVSPSANISVAAGNQSPGISLDGLGASGNGYLSSGAVLPTAGTITSSTEIPQEFI